MFTPNPKPITEQTPREIDEQLAHWYGELGSANYTLESAQHRYNREAPTATPERLRPFAEALAKARARVEEVHAAIKPFNEEFTRRGGWKRYFLVTKGHVHRERNCHTCRWNTVYGWLPELSDCDETKMVEQYGDQACAECFPGVLNHPAFLAGAAARKAHEDALKAVQCPTSAQPVGKANRTPNGRRARCPSCNCIVPITKYGLFRQHNPPPPRQERCPGSGSQLRNGEGEVMDGRTVTCRDCGGNFTTNTRGCVPVHKRTEVKA